MCFSGYCLVGLEGGRVGHEAAVSSERVRRGSLRVLVE